MYKSIFIIIFNLLALHGFSQTQLPDFTNCDFINQKEIPTKTYTLVLVARAGCDYSNDAIKDLVSLSDHTHLDILIYEYGDLSTIRFLHEEFFDSFPFIHAKSCKFYSNDYSPVLFLYKNKQLVWRKEGWTTKYLKKIQNKIKSS